VYGSHIEHDEIWCEIIGPLLPHYRHHNSGTIVCWPRIY